MKGLHYVLHAPQGDTYADLLFTMIERRNHRPPVSYTTFQARDLGADTSGLFKTPCRDAVATVQAASDYRRRHRAQRNLFKMTPVVLPRTMDFGHPSDSA
jgi:hypothetical protein